ncbi:hypothetical protein B0A48_01145 [Cryoendolithus antarcticus]|uniref:Uncharacterized protein n=1 Tax=Cryoendolithus antarcticus TaxID=1507870 RepID=A0A1V8TSD7_9PEZI|nr:hypothetical protein B0A48_01145 [Cryoendolithus antarcticus]
MFRKLFARLKDRLTPPPPPSTAAGSRLAFEEDKETLNKGLPLKRTTGGKRDWE